MQAIMGRCGRFSFDFGRDFDGTIDTRRVGRFDCASLTQTSRATVRSWRELDGFAAQHYLVILQLAGSSRMEQSGRATEMAPGDLTIIDSTLPSRFGFDRKNTHLSLHIPKSALDARDSKWCERTATSPPMRASTPLTSLIRAAFESDGSMSDAQRESISAAILHLLGSTWELDRAALKNEQCEDAVLRSIQEYVLRQLDNDQLSPQSVAAANNMSERQLHRVFEASGVSICRWIRQNRLERCAADLRDRTQMRRTVTEIAFRWGFTNPTHFCRMFRAEFAQSPREYRAAPSVAGSRVPQLRSVA
jgi:AraC-like DNA-binding protein